jgi:hypothetical protein
VKVLSVYIIECVPSEPGGLHRRGRPATKTGTGADRTHSLA